MEGRFLCLNCFCLYLNYLKLHTMRIIITSFLLFIGVTAWSQTINRTQPGANPPSGTTTTDQPAVQRAVQTQVKETSNLAYDVNDRYMGRKNEFLNSMIVSELPEDFPVYDRIWSVKDYSAVVEAYYANHMNLLKDRVKEKMYFLHPELKK